MAITIGNNNWPTCPKRSDPLLWVKPIGARGNAVFEDVPTSNSKISALIKAAGTLNLSRQDVEELLRCDKRVYRRIGVGDRDRDGIENWIIDSQGNARLVEKLTETDCRLWRDSDE